MMRRARILIVAACCGSLGLLGCLHSAVEEAWGDAVAANVEAQTADPDAQHPAPEGIDPVTGEHVASRYYKGQRTQQTRRAKPVVLMGK